MILFQNDIKSLPLEKLDSDYGEEEICIGNHCLYLYLPRTAKRKKLNTNYLEKLFGVDLTMRKLNVVEKLLTNRKNNMSRRESVEFVNMCLIKNGDKVLVQDRVSPNWPGITFPGGHVERGESFVDAVIREVKEETGLTISKPQLCGIKDWYDDADYRYVVLFYKTEHFTGELNFQTKEKSGGRILKIYLIPN